MNLYLDTTEEFATSCCALLRAADKRGPVCADWLAVSGGEQGHDRQTRAWLEALATWTIPADARETLIAENAIILKTGRAYHALLADVALALLEGFCGAALLARLQPHFPGIDLPKLTTEVLAAEDAYQQATKRARDRFFASHRGGAKSAKTDRKPNHRNRYAASTPTPHLNPAPQH